MRRAEARAQALSLLYEADTRGEDVGSVLARRSSEELLDDYAVALVQGVAAHASEIDRAIEAHARRWELGHMPVVDRNALRLGIYELVWGSLPPAVAMDEAIELCKRFSTDDAGRFVNGILAAIAGEESPT
jgi:transcription antitermination protein NusB